MSNSKVTILDGGMGRELERRGAPFKQPEWSALAMIEAPEMVKEVHKDFIRSGAEVITTNSYALVPFHIGEQRFRDRGRDLAAAAGQAARQAVEETGSNTLVAGSIPPLFGSYRADFYQPDRVSEIATPLIEGLAPSVDLWLCETQSLLAEALSVRALINTLDDQNKPVWISFTLKDEKVLSVPLLRSGEPVADAVQALAELKVEAILFNCCQPEVVGAAIRVTRDTLAGINGLELQIGAYGNAFAPQPKDAVANEGTDEIRADLTPERYLHWAELWRQQGATLIGGCCGIGPEHIALLKEKMGG